MDINEILKKLPPAPAEVTRWIHKDVVKKRTLSMTKRMILLYAQGAVINSERRDSTWSTTKKANVRSAKAGPYIRRAASAERI